MVGINPVSTVLDLRNGAVNEVVRVSSARSEGIFTLDPVARRIGADLGQAVAFGIEDELRTDTTGKGGTENVLIRQEHGVIVVEVEQRPKEIGKSRRRPVKVAVKVVEETEQLEADCGKVAGQIPVDVQAGGRQRADVIDDKEIENGVAAALITVDAGKTEHDKRRARNDIDPGGVEKPARAAREDFTVVENGLEEIDEQDETGPGADAEANGTNATGVAAVGTRNGANDASLGRPAEITAAVGSRTASAEVVRAETGRAAGRTGIAFDGLGLGLVAGLGIAVEGNATTASTARAAGIAVAAGAKGIGTDGADDAKDVADAVEGTRRIGANASAVAGRIDGNGEIGDGRAVATVADAERPETGARVAGRRGIAAAAVREIGAPAGTDQNGRLATTVRAIEGASIIAGVTFASTAAKADDFGTIF